MSPSVLNQQPLLGNVIDINTDTTHWPDEEVKSQFDTPTLFPCCILKKKLYLIQDRTDMTTP